MRIIFMTGAAREQALRYLMERGEQVEAVITPLLSTRNSRFEKVVTTAVEFGVQVLPVRKDEITNTLKRLNYDLLVSCGFPYILEQDAIATARFAINVHPTLLPKYRGYRSGAYILMNNERSSGVTVHWLTAEMDKGDILDQQAYELSAFDTPKSRYRKDRMLEPDLLYRVIQHIKLNDLHPIPQDEAHATTYNYVRTPKDSEIDWNKSLKELYNEIRACDPDDYPAFFFVEGQKVCVRFWRPDKPPEEHDMV